MWDSCDIAYKAQIVGIHPTEQTLDKFKWLVQQIGIHHRTLQFAVAINGTRGIAAKATAIEKQDIDSLPMPSAKDMLDLSFWEEALKEDVLDYMTDYVRLGQGSNLLNLGANTDHVLAYASLYLRMLGSLYGNLKAADHVRLNGLIAQPFYFGQSPDVSWLGDDCEDALNRLVYEKTSETPRTVRVVRYREGNVILIVKPDRLRYWIRSTAIRDADDTLIDLREQEGW